MEPMNIPVPIESVPMARFFADQASIVNHMSNHLFVHPEAQAWATILPQWHDLLVDATRRYNERSRLLQTKGISHCELYWLWGQAIGQEIREANLLRWMACLHNNLFLFFGTRAILIVVERSRNEWIIRTSFIPGLGNPSETKEARSQCQPRRDHFRPTSARHRRYRRYNELHSKENQQRMERERNWSEVEWYFFRVFRPAIQFLRNEHNTHRTSDGRTYISPNRDYRLLFPRLPHEIRHNVQITTWREFRLRVGRMGETL